MATGSGLLETWPQEVQLVLLPFSLSIHWIMLEPVWPMMPRLQRREEGGNSMGSLMSIGKQWLLMVLPGFTVDLTFPVLESLSIVVSTLECTTP